MKIKLSHGNGAAEMKELVESIFVANFKNEFTSADDAAVLPSPGGRIAFTADGYTVRPLIFPGGDIGRLAVCGTVNDLLTTGGTPLYLSASFIIEENVDSETLETVARSMRRAADEAGVFVVTGDTKVVDGNGGLFISTAGIGAAGDVDIKNIAAGDVMLVNGTLGDHHACVLSSRMAVANDIRSDAAPLTELVAALIRYGAPVRGMRDITRGGLATVLQEISSATGLGAELDETALPVSAEVAGFCSILGLDPIYMGNEGKMLVVVPESYAVTALNIMKTCAYGDDSAVIGRFTNGAGVVMNTRIGGRRKVAPLVGEGLPRIC